MQMKEKCRMNTTPQFDTPILFLLFNRPETTRKVFERIRLLRPRQLFIAADGPRSGSDSDFRNCASARLITQNIDWQCDVKYRFLEKNYGCRRAVSGAIDWFFSQVSEGIILEDDCFPSADFFHFCSAALKKYRNNEKIMHINGTVHAPPALLTHDAWFSRYALVWGWASWARAWQKYDPVLLNYPFDKLKEVFPESEKSSRWRELLASVQQNKSGFDTWDFQWSAALFANDGLAVSPKCNLVENIGIGSGTHEISEKLQFSLPEKSIFLSGNINLPPLGLPDKKADDFIFNTVYRKSPLSKRAAVKIKKIF